MTLTEEEISIQVLFSPTKCLVVAGEVVVFRDRQKSWLDHCCHL